MSGATKEHFSSQSINVYHYRTLIKSALIKKIDVYSKK